MREVYVVCCLELGRQCTEVFFTGYRCLLLFESRQVRVFWGSQKKLKRNILLWSKVYRHNMQNMYTARLEEKKKRHSILLDRGVVLISWCSHSIYFCPELHTFFTKILHWWWDERVGTLCEVFSSTSQRFSVGFRSGLCRDQSICENDVSCSLNHSFSPMKCGVVVLEYACAIREENNPLVEKPGHSLYSDSQLA